jgi:protoporphyrinogen oxidase
MFERRLLDYPLSMSPHLVRALGIQRLMAIGGSYLLSRFAGKKPIVSMEDFYTARFGRALFETFFKTYTEKVWGLPCSELAADWGAQRIRGLSAGKVLMHALNVFRRSGGEISLAEEFLYPEKGPGQLWETAGGIVENHGGEIRRNCLATKVLREGNRIAALRFRAQNGSEHTVPVRALFSSMALRDLIGAIEPAPPDEVIRVARALPYRNFITVGLLLSRLWCVLGKKNEVLHRLPDNWIYVQDPSVRLGRIQFPKNWSPAMVDDPRNEWISLEYFCSGGDSLWSMSDQAMIGLGIDEIGKVGIARREDVVDACVVRMPDAYPVYSGAYKNLAVIRDYLDGIDNLYPIGRNGLHRYNNQDHSVMTGLIAARLAREGSPDKKKIWDVNTEQEYCEER